MRNRMIRFQLSRKKVTHFLTCLGVLIATAFGSASPLFAQPATQPDSPTPTAVKTTEVPGTAVEDTSAPILLPSYRINPGDSLDISVYQKPELCKQIIIPPDGRIYYPFVGELAVAGRSLGEVRDELVKSLSKEIVNPQVSVAILKRSPREVSVLGPVKMQGKRTLGDSWRVLDLISDSGGLSVLRPEWVKGRLVRRGGAESIPVDLGLLFNGGDASQNVLLEPGDILMLSEVDPSQVSIYVQGQVAKPGNAIVPKDGSFAAVITSVGGLNPSAKLSDVTLKRDGKTLSVDMRSLLTDGRVFLSGTQEEVTAKPGDQLFISKNERYFAVTGAVNRPLTIDYPEKGKVSILQALALAGGPRGSAELKNAVLVRPVKDGVPETYPVDLENLLKKASKKDSDKKPSKDDKNAFVDIEMLPGDMLFVNEKGQPRTNTWDAIRSASALFPLFLFL
ncbi:MAG: hypothetical protein OHK0029_26040 [Armatimonadaceae bacterium]